MKRRHFLKTTVSAAAMFTTPGLFAEQLQQTAALTEGPFYPDKLPLDTDNDLIVINDATTPAVGEITHLGGKILSSSGEPLRNAFVEIWQVDNRGAYLHSGTANRDQRDTHFQGYGRFLTGSTGEYYFRTIKPVPYPGRTPHIHLAVSRHGKRILTTQILIRGHEQNERDGVFQRLKDPAARDTVMSDFQPIPNSKLGELAAEFDVVLGRTLEELGDGTLGVGIGKPEWRRPG